jgi:hypothetical protein
MKTKTKLDNKPHALAQEFVTRLKNCLTEDEILAIRRRNAKNEYNNCCASHDFIDANEVMADAFKHVIGHEMDAEREFHTEASDTALWNAAWDIAKREFLTAVADTIEPSEFNRGFAAGRQSALAEMGNFIGTIMGVRAALATAGGFEATVAVLDKRIEEWNAL